MPEALAQVTKQVGQAPPPSPTGLPPLTPAQTSYASRVAGREVQDIRGRGLTEQEKALYRPLFGNVVDQVRIHPSSNLFNLFSAATSPKGATLAGGVFPLVAPHNIWLTDPVMTNRYGGLEPGQILAHELVHTTQKFRPFATRSYDLPARDIKHGRVLWSELGPEQQATLIENYWARLQRNKRWEEELGEGYDPKNLLDRRSQLENQAARRKIVEEDDRYLPYVRAWQAERK
jgi:hypothetical protein